MQTIKLFPENTLKYICVMTHLNINAIIWMLQKINCSKQFIN